jgi:hypothetical protein
VDVLSDFSRKRVSRVDVPSDYSQVLVICAVLRLKHAPYAVAGKFQTNDFDIQFIPASNVKT